MTEEEAREKWCPMARVSHGVTGTTVNRWAKDHAPLITHCIASECMMWRWVHWTSLEQQNTADKFVPPGENSPPRLVPQKPEGDGWRRREDPRQWFGWTNWERPDYSQARGYCGLAGEPKS